jgi:hypothetical protein
LGNISLLSGPITNQSIAEDTATTALAFGTFDVEGNPVTVNAESDNTAIVTNANIVTAGTGATRSVTVTPVTNANGTTNITLTANDGITNSTNVFAVSINPANDSPTGTVTISGNATQGQTLIAANTLIDDDGLGAIVYQWQADGVDIAGATTATFVPSQAQVGKAITVKASYTDLLNTAESVTSAATAAIANLNDAPIGTVTITGTPTEDQTLTASSNLTDADGLGAVSYQWQANGIDIAGATTDTLVLGQAQVGKVITAKANYTDLQNTAESVTSAGTTAIANRNDLPTGTVTISGTTTQGQTLTASNTLADIDGLGTIAYQWQADNVDIAGATGATLILAQDQVGKAITVKASYTDLLNTAESATSAATDLVGGAPIVTQLDIQIPSNLSTIAGVVAQSVPNWATDLTQPVYLTGLSYVVTVDRPELFAQLPSISPTGQLIYEPKPYVNLNAAVNLTIQVKQADGSIDPNLTKNTTLNIKYKPEALIRNSATNEVGLLYIDRVTQLQAQRNLTQAGQTVKITPEWAISDTADFNRDGIADILLHNKLGDQVEMVMMDADGQVRSRQALTQNGTTLKTNNTNWNVVGFADIDRDNILDIVWHNQVSDEVGFWFMDSNGISVRSYDYLRDGSGAIFKTRNPLWQAHTAADFDGDGNTDLLFRLPELNQTAIVRLNGAALVNSQYVDSPTVGFEIRRAGDSNGDRITDIYWQNTDNTRVLIQTITAQRSSANFAPVVSTAPLQAIADLDLNNTNDLLFRSTGLLLNLVNPGQPQSFNTPLEQSGNAFQFSDVNWNIVQTDDFGEVTIS